MSTASAPYTKSTPHETCVCQYCDDEYRLADGHNRTYCSTRCRYNGAAHGLLEAIRHDHRFCVSCFRKLKDLTPPPSGSGSRLSGNVKAPFSDCDRWGRWHDDERVGGPIAKETAAPGYEWGTGEEFGNDPLNDDWSFAPTGYETQTKVCECGMSHHATVGYGTRQSKDGVKNFRQNLSKSELNHRADRLCAAINQLHAEGRHEWQFVRAALFAHISSLKEKLPNKGRDFLILERSLGYAIRRARS